MVFGPVFSTFIALTNLFRFFTESNCNKSVSKPEDKSLKPKPQAKPDHKLSSNSISKLTRETTVSKRKCGKKRRKNQSSSGIDAKRKKEQKERKRIGELKCLKVIGQGAFGKVYLCQDRETYLKYAVKKVTAGSDLQTLEKERKILDFGRKCSRWNPFLTTLASEFLHEDPRFIAMEYVEGGDLLTDLYKHDQMYPEPKARFYTAEIICGLEFLHLNGFVHRDLKFENILLHNGHVKIADFGNAFRLKGVWDKIEQHVLYGTPAYMAPEVILHLPYDSSCDWWSLGVMLFEMLTGSMPFYGKTREELFVNIVSEFPEDPSPEALSQISVEGIQLMLHLLEKDAQGRIGYKFGNFPCIKGHAFFQEINWINLAALKVDPP